MKDNVWERPVACLFSLLSVARMRAMEFIVQQKGTGPQMSISG